MSSSLFSNIQTSGNSAYLKLPKQNKQLIDCFFEIKNKKTAYQETHDSLTSLKSIRKKLNDIPFKILIYKINKTLKNLLKQQLRRNKQIVNLELNISFNDQPYEEESIFEDSDDETSSYIEDASQTSSSRSNQVQFDSIDETSSLMPIAID